MTISSVPSQPTAREVWLRHTVWSDHATLGTDGRFCRKSTKCSGSWSEHGTQLLLKWDAWGAEWFTRSSGVESVTAEYELATLLHLGCGPNTLNGWLNLDLPQVDIRLPLKYADNSVDAIFLEHVIEHVPPPDAFRFMREALRVLKAGGVLRMAFPDAVKIHRESTPDYLQFLRNAGWGDGTTASAVASIILNHGHCAIWSEETMRVTMLTAGFEEVRLCAVGESTHARLANLEKHGERIGDANNRIETCCMEGVKHSARD